MTELDHKMTDDLLFKLLFVKNPKLLRELVAELLGIDPASIGSFEVANTEMPPEVIGDKFCRLDVNMVVDGQRVSLEVQVENEGDYPERSLFMWARSYSTALKSGQGYAALPKTIVVSIVDFDLFKGSEACHSEFRALEVTRHEPLTDRLSLHYFELGKRPAQPRRDDMTGLWLALFAAGTEEDIERLDRMEVPTMSEAVAAYRSVAASEEFRELQRLRELARHNEAAALRHAAEVERAKWEKVVASNQAIMAEKDAEIARLRAQLEAAN